MSDRAALWLGTSALVLASNSRARRRLLEDAGVPVVTALPIVDERIGEAGWDKSGGGVSARLALMKALSVAPDHPDCYVLGADQTLTLGKRAISKPSSVNVATRQLRDLCGETHRLTSSAAIVRNGEILFQASEVAKMTMRKFSPAFLERYVSSVGDRLCESVGAYQIEDVGVQLFSRMEYSHAVIMGLPLMPVLEFFRQRNLLSS
jgi:septum formation protein